MTLVSISGGAGFLGLHLARRVLADGGTVTGSDGCNQLNGTWKVDGSEVEFGPFAATMMACEDVDTWLSGASSATVDGDEMTVLDENGKEVGTLKKA